MCPERTIQNVVRRGGLEPRSATGKLNGLLKLLILMNDAKHQKDQKNNAWYMAGTRSEPVTHRDILSLSGVVIDACRKNGSR